MRTTKSGDTTAAQTDLAQYGFDPHCRRRNPKAVNGRVAAAVEGQEGEQPGEDARAHTNSSFLAYTSARRPCGGAGLSGGSQAHC
jgi:hypothetical protein